MDRSPSLGHSARPRRNLRPLLGSLVLCLLLTGEPAPAQTDTLVSGRQVRITVDGALRVGTVTATDADSLTLRFERSPRPVQVAWSTISRIEVRRPRTRGEGAFRGAKRGAVFGAVYGLIPILTVGLDESVTATRLLANTTATGAVVGAVWGALLPGSTWAPVRAGPYLSVRRERGRPAFVMVVPW